VRRCSLHRSFNGGDQPARIIASLGPVGYEVVDVANDAPKDTLRK